MRKLILAVVILVGAGLALFFALGSDGPEATPVASSEQPLAPSRAAAPEKRAGTVLQPETPEDVGAKGTPSAGSTPTLAQAPSEEDGVLEVEVLAGERPVSGASVRLYWRGARDPRMGEVSWRLASSDSTDAQGRARLASRPGGYLVAVRAQGHALLLRDVVRPYGEARTQVRLTLEQGQSLTGRTVVQGTQESLPLVELVLTAHGRALAPWQRAEAPAEERVYAASDERGNFRVEGLAPGSYQLEARAPGHARTVLRNVRVPATGPMTVALKAAGVIEGFVVDAQGQPATGAEVQVGGRAPQVATTGQGGGFSVEVEPGSHIVSARRGDEAGSLDKPVTVSVGQTVRDVRVKLGKGSVLEGLVVAKATGAPVVGASVAVSPAGRSGDSGSAVTDDTGHFSVGGLAPGSYDLDVSAPGFSPLARRGLTVTAGERFPLELELTGTGAVEGQVKDGAGQPVQGAQVVGGTRWGGALGNTPAESRTDAQGRYRLEGLGAGTVYLTARREGSALGVSESVELREGGTAQQDFTLGETGTVEGGVRASSGSLPAEPLIVTASRRGVQFFGPTDVGRADVDATGNFRIMLPPGTYNLSASLAERRMFMGRGGTRVEVEAGKTVRTELTWQSEETSSEGMRGVVLEPDGAPSPGAFVSVETEGGLPGPRMMSPTDEEGRFTVNLPPLGGSASSLRFKLSARNGGRTGDVLGVRQGEQEVVVKLRPGGSVRGRVVRAGGAKPVQGFTLVVQPQGSGRFVLNNTSWEFPGDRFEVRDVPAEPLKLVARTADGAGGEALATPTSGGGVEVEITLKPTASVHGRLMDSTTKAPMDSALIFIEGERRPGMDAPTTRDGRFTLEGLSAGEHVLLIVPGGARAPERKPIKLEEGQVLDLGDILIGPPRPPPGSVGVMLETAGTQVIVSELLPGSPAASAGVQVGDVVLEVDGTPVTALGDAFRRLPGAPGSTVVIKVRRGGAEQTLSVTRAPP
jgi:hypothetical protein